MRPIRISETITFKETDSLKLYLKDVSKIDLFKSPEEEFKCGEKAAKGDEKAIQEMVSRNLRFVISVAKQYASASTPLEDLITEGNIGLLEAARRYDPTMGNRFLSFAVWYIRKDILKYLYTCERTVRLPQNKVHELSQLNQEINILENTLGRVVTSEELQTLPKFKHLSTYEIEEVLSLGINNTSSLDLTIGNEDSVSTIGDLLKSDMYENGDDYMINIEGRINLDKLLSNLDDKSQTVLKLYFGVDNLFPMGLKEIGDIIGVSRERVRQIKEAGLEKLSLYANIEEFSELLE